MPNEVIGDVTRIRQILVNLVGNAVKFTSEGEMVVSVTGEEMENGRVQVQVAVIDTGIGIPPGRMDRLFQSFSQVDSSTTSSFGGSGLGLVISKKLAEGMGGRLWVESELERGSTFAFTLPLEVVQETTDWVSAVGQKRILVVDDNALNRLILNQYLQWWQVTSRLASAGPEALEILAQEPPFDCIILDMQMPGMDGAQLAAEICKLP